MSVEDTDDPQYTMSAVAQLFRVTERAARRWAHSGALPATTGPRKGKPYLIRASVIRGILRLPDDYLLENVRLLLPKEASEILHINNPKTLERWNASGILTAIRTPGLQKGSKYGDFRYLESAIRALAERRNAERELGPFMLADDVGAILRVSGKTLLRWRAAGVLTAILLHNGPKSLQYLESEIRTLARQSTGKLAPLLTAGEVALRLRINIHTVYRRIEAGDLVAFRLRPDSHKTLRLTEHAVGEYLRVHRV
jgi:predicted site-specific integrase-resolvase